MVIVHGTVRLGPHRGWHRSEYTSTNGVRQGTDQGAPKGCECLIGARNLSGNNGGSHKVGNDSALDPRHGGGVAQAE